ncbi:MULTISPECIES: methyltransferase [Vibrio]|uniref:methyltransferase n=1 Tax=Vibrio TaxID=662 RepID=UPI002076092B|nr:MULTISPECIES: methyltransferase [Vibrio]USD33362.1 methyltransferase [Vibrio sp. SCSIO 43186]USD46432.1 methyltransferase [Vibrio sp. SCSIO 43145]USD70486.1 methyltransferase [Vibrio sp. SCSIO 43139]USD95404.1 SAM-dependent methyltransferase [Vibrio coralliilyticus]
MQNTFLQLDSFLYSYQNLWRFEPFFSSIDQQLPWHDDYPELCDWLMQLDHGQIESLKSDSRALTDALQAFIPDLEVASVLTQLPVTLLQGLQLDRGLDAGVPGRKLEQIVSMGEAALQSHQGSEWLEWCSGKGFLGRLLASQSQQPVTSFEFQKKLCESGQREADKHSLPMTFIQGDALSADAVRALNPNQHAVALHACGDLHVSLIEKAVLVGLPAITISPCCYHLIQHDQYQTLSRLAKSSSLVLTLSELRIPLQETVTGGERVKRHRFQEMSYRLGFDLLLREAGRYQDYVPIPSIKKSLLADGFESFCYWAAEKKQLALPVDVSFREFQLKGELRYWQMERLSLVQQHFRRSLEMWLVLDKALYLAEHGYEVSVEMFCEKKITPRNILIQAVKK